MDHHFIAFAILKEVEAEKAREEARAKELAAGIEEHIRCLPTISNLAM